MDRLDWDCGPMASILGLMPSLLILFLVANILYIIWYIGIGARFPKLAA